MKHKKDKHFDRVALCWKFTSGHCSYGDTDCCFKHVQCEESQEITNLICNLGDNKFLCLSDVQKHRKQQHTIKVLKCKNEKDGNCKFGKKFCRFIHEKHENVLENDNNEEVQNGTIQKVLGMLETMTEVN